MITLGLNAAFHDSSAALVIDGELVAASEEERFTRIKHAKRPLPFTAWELPFHAIDDCLRQAGLKLTDVDHVAYSFDVQRFLRQHRVGDSITLPLQPSAHRAAALADGWDSPWDPLFASYMANVPRLLADGAPHHLRGRLAGARPDGPYRFHGVDHHLSHQASAFLAAPFERCAVMVLDGRGEHATTSYGVYRDDRFELLGEVGMPHSLGLLYERITSHLGFLHSSDEYKVMALAALGEPRWQGLLAEQIEIGEAGVYRVRPMDLTAMFGPPRERGSEMQQRDFDLAASLQAVLEASVLKLATWLREASGERHLAMAGGVALNCVMNAKLRDAGLFDQVWVQPAAGDAGTALGAALWIDAKERGSAERLAPRTWQMQHAYWGPSYDDAEIERFLQWAKLPYRKLGDVARETAALLAEGKVIGWHQGRMEFGPRALGARSILASPIEASMQARINELKDREDFRPVAPAVTEEAIGEWFTPAAANGGVSPFMLFIYDVLPEQAKKIPAACHSDLTARVQTVSARAQPRFHALLSAFAERTGVPVLINTSFNVRGEPVVCSPKDAVNAFATTPIDALVIGDCLVLKEALK
jgi:carbamoyltransferase